MKHMNATRCVDMAGLDGYAELLRKCAHSVKIYVVDDNKSKKICMKAAKHIFQECK